MKRYQPNREVIAERLEKWRKLTPQEQLADLDRRLGPGVGAVKQRARIAAPVVISKSQEKRITAQKGAK